MIIYRVDYFNHYFFEQEYFFKESDAIHRAHEISVAWIYEDGQEYFSQKEINDPEYYFSDIDIIECEVK